MYASLLSFSPFLMREFYAKGTMNKFGVVAGIFVGAYGLLMRGPFVEMEEYNRRIAQENIGKFSLELEEQDEE